MITLQRTLIKFHAANKIVLDFFQKIKILINAENVILCIVKNVFNFFTKDSVRYNKVILTD